jgi:hypothetical protein
MKNILLWGALLTLVCAQTQAETNPQPTNTTTTTTTTTTIPTNQPADQGTQPNMPVQAQPTTGQTGAAPIINCEYKIDASTKVVDQSLIINWSEKATVQAFDFNPSTIDEQMKKLQGCFTEQGWTGFNTALEKSGNLEAIKNQHLTVSSQIDGQAKIDEAKDNQWKVALPLQVVYQNDKEKVTQLLDIKLAVSRKVNGDLGITQLIATPRATAGAVTAPIPAPTTTPATNTDTPVVTTPNDSTGQPTTSAPNGTPTTPTGATAPTVGNPAAQPSTTTTDQQKP